jgi:hypothetical protein
MHTPRTGLLSIRALISVPLKQMALVGFWHEAEDKKLWDMPKRVVQQPKALPLPMIPINTLPLRVPRSTVLSRATWPSAMM